jgi:hypothetical protein
MTYDCLWLGLHGPSRFPESTALNNTAMNNAAVNLTAADDNQQVNKRN